MWVKWIWFVSVYYFVVLNLRMMSEMSLLNFYCLLWYYFLLLFFCYCWLGDGFNCWEMRNLLIGCWGVWLFFVFMGGVYLFGFVLGVGLVSYLFDFLKLKFCFWMFVFRFFDIWLFVKSFLGGVCCFVNYECVVNWWEYCEFVCFDWWLDFLLIDLDFVFVFVWCVEFVLWCFLSIWCVVW